MKTTIQTLSGNPFVNIFRLAVAKLQKKEIAKRAALSLFVLLCILLRFSIISADKNLVKQNKQSFSAENMNQPVWPAKLIFKKEQFDKPLFMQYKAQHKSFSRSKKSLNSSLAN